MNNLGRGLLLNKNLFEAGSFSGGVTQSTLIFPSLACNVKIKCSTMCCGVIFPQRAVELTESCSSIIKKLLRLLFIIFQIVMLLKEWIIT
jgi:hypothetical protein